jgi:hypothetical protein
MLFNADIMAVGAYALYRPPREGEGMSAKDELWKTYSAHFVRDWPIGDEAYGLPQVWRHAEHPNNWTPNFWRFIDKLEGNIRANGLQNPVLVTWRNGRFNLHPGKCRVWCLRNLGINTVPAILVWYGDNLPVRIDTEYEIRSAAQLSEHFEGDIAPEMCRRGIRTPKKR